MSKYHEERDRTLAIDFDGVIHDLTTKSEVPNPGSPPMGIPIYGAIESMQWLHSIGKKLVIFTTRGGSPAHVENWLNFYNIPFDEVTNIKPAAALYIDDKAVKFTSWEQIINLHELGNSQ